MHNQNFYFKKDDKVFKWLMHYTFSKKLLIFFLFIIF